MNLGHTDLIVSEHARGINFELEGKERYGGHSNFVLSAQSAGKVALQILHLLPIQEAKKIAYNIIDKIEAPGIVAAEKRRVKI